MPTLRREKPRRTVGQVVGLVIAVLAVVAIVGAVAFVFLVGSDDNAALAALSGKWKPVTTKSGRFTIDMPPGASFSSQAVDLPNGTRLRTETIYGGDGTIDDANVGLMFLEQDLGPAGLPPEMLAATFDQSLTGMATGAVGSRNGKVTDTHRVDSPLGPAGRFSGTFAGEGYVMEGFGVLHGSTLIAVMSIVPDDQAPVAATTVDRAVASLVAH